MGAHFDKMVAQMEDKWADDEYDDGLMLMDSSEASLVFSDFMRTLAEYGERWKININKDIFRKAMAKETELIHAGRKRKIMEEVEEWERQRQIKEIMRREREERRKSEEEEENQNERQEENEIPTTTAAEAAADDKNNSNEQQHEQVSREERQEEEDDESPEQLYIRCEMGLQSCARMADPNLDVPKEILEVMFLGKLNPGPRCYFWVLLGMYRCVRLGTMKRQEAGKQGEEMVALMKRRNVRRTREIYNVLISIYGSWSSPSLNDDPEDLSSIAVEMEDVNRVYSKMLDDGLRPDLFTYNMLIIACSRVMPSADMERALFFFNQMQIANIKPDVKTFASMFCVCSRTMPRCEMETAMKLHQTMKDHNIKSSVESYSSLLCVFRRSGRSGGGDVAGAMRMMEEMEAAAIKTDARTYNIMLDVCSCVLPHSDVSTAQAVWRRMEEQGIAPDEFCYNTMICIWGRSGRQGGGVEALRLWRQMKEHRGLTASVITFNSLIDALSREEGGAMMAEVNDVYSTMVGRGVKPDFKIYNTLISACSRAKPFADTSRAKELYLEAKRVGIKMDNRIFNSLITCFSRASGGGDVEGAMWARREMEAAGIEPDAATMNCVMTTVNNSGRQDCWEVAKQLLEDMRQRGIRPIPELLSSMMTACARGGGSISEAMSVFRQMTEGERAVVPGEACFNSLLNVCIGSSSSSSRIGSSREFSGDMDAAMSVFAEMKRRGIRPDIMTFGALISGCSRRRGGADVELGMSLFREMESMGIEGNLWMYNSIIQLFCCGNNNNSNSRSSFQKRLVSNGDLENAMAVFSRMKEQRIEPNAVTFNTLISGCSRTDPVRLDLAMEVYEEAKRQQQQQQQRSSSSSSSGGMMIDSMTMSSLFTVCSRIQPCADLDTAMRIMREAEEMDIEIKTDAWNSLLQVCRNTRQPSIEMAEDVVRRMKGGSDNRRSSMQQDMNDRNVRRRGGCEPNSATYSTLLMCYVRSHYRSDWEKGLRVFEGVEDVHRIGGPVYSAALHLIRNLIHRGGLSRQEEEEARRYGRRIFEEAERRVRPWPDKFVIEAARRAGVLG